MAVGGRGGSCRLERAKSRGSPSLDGTRASGAGRGPWPGDGICTKAAAVAELDRGPESGEAWEEVLKTAAGNPAPDSEGDSWEVLC